jgi:hypothetical protein
MKKYYKILLVVLSFAVVLLIGCKKDSSTPADTYKKPSITEKTTIITVPEKLSNSTDVHAQMAAGYMNMANAFSSYSALLTPPPNAVKSSLKSSGVTYTWSDSQGNMYILTYVESATNYTWTMYIKTTQIPKTKFIEGQESKDGKSGSLIIYNYSSGISAEQAINCNWTYDSSNNMSFTMILNSGDSGYYMTIDANANNSGEFVLYIGTSSSGLKVEDIIWNSDGSGTWDVWDTEPPYTKYSGSWTA